ncbi:hypothetical protein ACFE04_030247 [Oxalis oulophora]
MHGSGEMVGDLELASLMLTSADLMFSNSKVSDKVIVASALLVQRDFEELPGHAFRSLQVFLNTLLIKFHMGPPKVRTHISIAVAALAVHVPSEEWGDGGIVHWLGEKMKSNPEYVPGFLELLTVLPEEVFNYKIAARSERRRQFEMELTTQMETALNILTSCLSINGLVEQVLEAFASWLRLKHGVPESVLASHLLVLTALSSLNSDIISEASFLLRSSMHTLSSSFERPLTFLIDISGDGFVSLLTHSGNTKDELKLPTDDTLLTQGRHQRGRVLLHRVLFD